MHKGIKNQLPPFKFLPCSQITIEAVYGDLALAFVRPVTLNAICLEKRRYLPFEGGVSVYFANPEENEQRKGCYPPKELE